MSDTISDALLHELVRQQEAMGWPEMVPRWAELRRHVFKKHENLTVADCEQIVEWRTRRARRAINLIDSNPRMLRVAAKNVLLARLYRCEYLGLIGKTDSTEADMPFPLVTK